MSEPTGTRLEPLESPPPDRPAARTFPGPNRSWWCRHPCPPYPPPTGCRRVLIPFYGHLDANDQHRARVDRFFDVPMLILALLVLPLLGIEWLQYHHNYAYVGQAILEHPIALAATTAAMVLIWLAFLVEFVIKISIAPSRAQYAWKHWLGIVIIALPLLRPLRAARVLRAARTARIFTIRGVAMRILRAGIALVLGLQFVKRIQGRFRKAPPAAPLDYDQWPREALIAEIHRLQDTIRRLEGRSNPGEPTDAGLQKPPQEKPRS